MPSDHQQASPLAELTQGMLRGDNAAWQRFHEQYGSMMFRILLASSSGNFHLASEALQRAYLRVSRHVRFCDNEAMWISWLRTVCRSSLSDSRRRDYSFWNFLRRQEEEPRENETLSVARENEWFHKLDRAMAQLSLDTRSLLEAKYYRGESVQAIADQRSLSLKSVESRLTRARAELRALLSNHPISPRNE